MKQPSYIPSTAFTTEQASQNYSKVKWDYHNNSTKGLNVNESDDEGLTHLEISSIDFKAGAEWNEKKNREWKICLLNLTPSGSEFVDDPKNCYEFVKNFQEGQHKTIINLTKKLKEMQVTNKINYPVGTVVKDMYNLNEDEDFKPNYTKRENGKWSGYESHKQGIYTIDEAQIVDGKRYKLISMPDDNLSKKLDDYLESIFPSNSFDASRNKLLFSQGVYLQKNHTGTDSIESICNSMFSPNRFSNCELDKEIFMKGVNWGASNNN